VTGFAAVRRLNRACPIEKAGHASSTISVDHFFSAESDTPLPLGQGTEIDDARGGEPKSMRHRFLAMELKVPPSTLSVSNLSDTMAAVG